MAYTHTPSALFTPHEFKTQIPLPLQGTVGTMDDTRLGLWHTRYRQALEYQQQAGCTTNWSRYMKWYRAWRQPLTQPFDWWRSNETIPTVFKVVEGLVAKHVTGFYSEPNWFNARGIEGTDEVWELAIESLLRETFEEMDVVPKTTPIVRYLTIMGHIWGKLTWREEWQRRTVLEPRLIMDPLSGMPLQVGMQKSSIDEKTIDRPELDYRTLDMIKADPTGKGNWYIEEFDTTLEELEETNRRMGGIYSNLGELYTGSTTNANQRDYQEPQSTESIPQTTAFPLQPGNVAIWQCWGWVPRKLRPKGDENEWRLLVIANRSTVIRDIPAPTPDGRPPYFPIRYIEVPNLLYGQSLLHYIGPLADQQTRLANHRLDQISLNVFGQYIYDRSAGITANEMLFQPGGAIPVNGDPSKVFFPLPRHPVHPEAWREDDYRQQQIEHTSGMTDIMQGVSDVNRPTATSDQIKFQQGSARFIAQSLWFDQTFKRELLNRTFKLLQMRMPDERVFRVIGTDGMEFDVTLDIRSIQIPVDFILSGGMMGQSKQERLQTFQEMIGIAGNPTLGVFIQADAVLRDYYKSKGVHAVNRYVKTMAQVMFEKMLMGEGGGPSGLGSGQPAIDGGGGAGASAQGQLQGGMNGAAGLLPASAGAGM